MSNNTRIAFVYAGEVLSAAIALPTVGMIVVGLRFWSRIHHKQGLGWDDWFILAAVVSINGIVIAL